MNEDYPSLGEQANNVVNLIQDAITDVLKGNQLFASDEEQKRRMDICRKCAYYSEEDVRCRSCGCFLNQKTSLNASKCPLNYWDDSETVTSWF